MRKVVQIKILDYGISGEEYNHAFGTLQGDVTLCGEDHAGDDDRIIKYIRGKITCPRCIEIITYCKSFRNEDISQNAL